MLSKEEPAVRPLQQGAAAVFYGVSSIAIISVNKVVLTSYGFPSASFVGLAQMVFTIFALYLARALGLVSFPGFDGSIIRKVFPLPLLFLLNLVTGLGGTQRISLPMFTMLRRFSILFTMILEHYLLNSKQTMSVQVSVALMIGGAAFAAMNDLSFDMYGYMMLLLNDIFTACNGVYVKKKLDAKDLGSFGLMLYNSLLSLPLMMAFMLMNPAELEEVFMFPLWSDRGFQSLFILSGLMGVVLTYSIFLCTQLNSALTTTVVGCFKNVFVSYIGIFLGGDYIFSMLNFVGLNISVFGSIVYAVVKFKQQGTAVL
eukprot:m.246192 g.246192  ORF g.246192 m.246192 type:complete len:314 (-) comp14935_c0_seq1:117-1058(-)